MYRYISDYLIVHRLQLAKFVIVGLVVFGVNFLCFHLLYRFVRMDYRVAVSLAYVISVISHFLLHRIFTFGAAAQELVHNVWKYLLMIALNYTITLLTVWFSVTIMESSPYLGLIESTAATAIVSFLVMRHFVFKTKSDVNILQSL